MNILVSGGSGFIGAVAVDSFCSQGHKVIRLVRPSAGQPSASSVVWEPSSGRLDALPQPLDAVVHLAGENILGLWTQAKKQRIYDSRIKSTALLAARLAELPQKPSVFICASAVGFYGHCGDAVLTETAGCGQGFLSRVCRDWEAATEPAYRAGIRTVCLRFGMVLAEHGGALAKMLPVFRLGLGGAIGDGSQWTSWITLADAVRVIGFAIDNILLAGAVNAVVSEPVRNSELTKELGRVLHRPAALAVPSSLLRLGLGDFAREVLLSSTRAVPEKLRSAGFAFRHPSLGAALADILEHA